jgi:dihydroxyacid dehydratase/phosphogluconate dehydratase
MLVMSLCSSAAVPGDRHGETYQLTSACVICLKENHCLITTLVSAVSHWRLYRSCVGPEALAGGPLGKLRDGDTVQVIIDCVRLSGRIDFIGEEERRFDPDVGSQILATRLPHPQLRSNPDLPDDTRLWAALQNVSGGTWGGCVYDVDQIIEQLQGAA